jgi:hypothetical protein
LGEVGHVAALAFEPTAAMDAEDGGQRFICGLGAVKIQLQRAVAVGGIRQVWVRFQSGDEFRSKLGGSGLGLLGEEQGGKQKGQ